MNEPIQEEKPQKIKYEHRFLDRLHLWKSDLKSTATPIMRAVMAPCLPLILLGLVDISSQVINFGIGDYYESMLLTMIVDNSVFLAFERSCKGNDFFDVFMLVGSCILYLLHVVAKYTKTNGMENVYVVFLISLLMFLLHIFRRIDNTEVM